MEICSALRQDNKVLDSQFNFSDSRAATLKAVTGAVCAAASLETAARLLLGSPGWFDICLPIFSSAGFLGVCIYVLLAERPSTSVLVLNTNRREPRFSLGLRNIAKAAIAPFLVLLAMHLWDLRPNVIAGSTYISGFVCNSVTGEPVSGTVEILDRAGQPVSEHLEVLDDRGFFYADAKRWSLRPYLIDVKSQSCEDAKHIITHSSHGRCIAEGSGRSYSLDIQEIIIPCHGK